MLEITKQLLLQAMVTSAPREKVGMKRLDRESTFFTVAAMTVLTFKIDRERVRYTCAKHTEEITILSGGGFVSARWLENLITLPLADRRMRR